MNWRHLRLQEASKKHNKESSLPSTQISSNFHMSLQQGTKLRNDKVIDSLPEESTSTILVMAASNSNDSDTNEISDISSQLTEMKENNERKIGDSHSKFSQLEDLMMAVIKKSNEETPSTSSQGLVKQPQRGSDIVTGVTETHSTRPALTFTSNIRHYHDSDTDDDGDTTPRSQEEGLLSQFPSVSRIQRQIPSYCRHTSQISVARMTNLWNLSTSCWTTWAHSPIKSQKRTSFTSFKASERWSHRILALNPNPRQSQPPKTC